MVNFYKVGNDLGLSKLNRIWISIAVLKLGANCKFNILLYTPLRAFSGIINFYNTGWGTGWEGMSNDAPIHECESEIDHYTGHYVPYSLRRVCGLINVPRIFYYLWKGLWDGAYGLSSLSEKTRKSNRLLMLLQRQHFLLSYLKILRVGPAEVWTYGLPLSRPALIPLS